MKNIIFVLWGNFAKKKKIFINDNHYILEAPHPSPLAMRKSTPEKKIPQWFGSKHFSKTNEILIKNGQKPINWLLYNK